MRNSTDYFLSYRYQSSMPGFGTKRKSTNAGGYAPKRYKKAAAKKTTRVATSSGGNYAKMLRDPWTLKHGVALPDEFRGPTCPLILTQTFTPAGGASDTFSAMRFQPNLSGFAAHAGVGGGATNTGYDDFSAHAEYSSGLTLSSSAVRYRILSICWKVNYEGPSDTCGGTCSYIFKNEMGNLATDTTMWADAHADSGQLSITRRAIRFQTRLFDRPYFTLIGSGNREFLNGLALAFEGVDKESIRITTRVFCEVLMDEDSPLADTARPSPGGHAVATPV